jgi:hypothetical protein
VTTTQFEPLPDLAAAEPSTGTLVMKFGGTSVADPEKITGVARRLVEAQAGGNRVVAVLSAMGHTTDDLVRLAYEVSPRPKPRELDMLISVGERISCALAAMAIHDLGAEAISLTGSQAGIVTDTVHGRAKIVDVRARRIHEALDQDRIVLVAGFQGVSTDFDITTLGRGGSDTTAVALAAALGAGSSRLRGNCTPSATRRCSRWPRRARRCCRYARSRSPAATTSSCTSARRSRRRTGPGSGRRTTACSRRR